MNIEDVKKNAFAMPLTSPAYPKTEFRFFNREYFIISYETDIEALRAIVPEPLELTAPIVNYEFIKMPDSTGFGDYTESGQVIPVEFNGKRGGYVHAMYLDDEAPLAGGREIWGFPKKYAYPSLEADTDSLIGRLKYNNVEVAIGTMGYKHTKVDLAKAKANLVEAPSYLLKIIPNCNGKDVDICQLVEYYLENVEVKEAWVGPAALQLFHHALAPVAELPVKRIISATHMIADLSLGFGKVIYDYLADKK